MSKWIKFVKREKAAKKKTDTYEVKSIDDTSNLGLVQWYGPWRKYSFFPAPNTLFETDCLKDIVSFIEKLMLERKIEKQNEKTKNS